MNSELQYEYHVVENNETLQDIAVKYNVSIDHLKSVNKFVSRTELIPGECLRIQLSNTSSNSVLVNPSTSIVVHSSDKSSQEDTDDNSNGGLFQDIDSDHAVEEETTKFEFYNRIRKYSGGTNASASSYHSSPTKSISGARKHISSSTDQSSHARSPKHRHDIDAFVENVNKHIKLLHKQSYIASKRELSLHNKVNELTNKLKSLEEELGQMNGVLVTLSPTSLNSSTNASPAHNSNNSVRTYGNDNNTVLTMNTPAYLNTDNNNINTTSSSSTNSVLAGVDYTNICTTATTTTINSTSSASTSTGMESTPISVSYGNILPYLCIQLALILLLLFLLWVIINDIYYGLYTIPTLSSTNHDSATTGSSCSISGPIESMNGLPSLMDRLLLVFHRRTS